MRGSLFLLSGRRIRRRAQSTCSHLKAVISPLRAPVNKARRKPAAANGPITPSFSAARAAKDFDLRNSPADDAVELSLPVAPGQELAGERLMFSVGKDYHAQLLAYGDAIRRLHHARVNSETPIGWWS